MSSPQGNKLLIDYKEMLMQLLVVTWDGNLISKSDRDYLVKNGLAQRAAGYNWLTPEGVQYLVDLGELTPSVNRR